MTPNLHVVAPSMFSLAAKKKNTTFFSVVFFASHFFLTFLHQLFSLSSLHSLSSGSFYSPTPLSFSLTLPSIALHRPPPSSSLAEFSFSLLYPRTLSFTYYLPCVRRPLALPPYSLHSLFTLSPFFNLIIPPKQSMIPTLHRSHRLSPLSWLLGTLSLLAAMASAQSPASTYGMAYTTIDESTLYIQGGIILPPPGGTAKIASQFYTLDLTQDWNATSPPWKALTPPTNVATTISSQSMTISPDRQTLTLWSVYPTVALNYSIADASWTRVPLTAGQVISGSGLHAATDPATGMVYIPGAGSLSTNYLVRYNYLTGLTTLINIPMALVPVLDSYSFVWCQARKSFLLFAGNVSNVNAFSEYSPSTGQWTQLVCHTDKIRH